MSDDADAGPSEALKRYRIAEQRYREYILLPTSSAVDPAGMQLGAEALRAYLELSPDEKALTMV